MDILQLIDRLEELFNEARAVPFTHNVVVDEDRMLEVIDQMRIVIPDEVKKAQQVLSSRDRFLAQAQEEADRTIALARDKAEQIAALGGDVSSMVPPFVYQALRAKVTSLGDQHSPPNALRD